MKWINMGNYTNYKMVKIHSARQCFDCLGSFRCRILSSQTLVQASDQVNKVHYCNRT